jgi:AraC-like DNA-binding protein
VKTPGHLRIEEIKLSPSEELTDDSDAWRFLRLRGGAAYWLDTARPRLFSEGELLVLAPRIKAVLRASQLNEVTLDAFKFAPDLLFGFFTLAERHFLENRVANCAEPVLFLPSTHILAQRLAELASHHDPGQELAERTEVLGLAVAFLTEGLPRARPAPSQGLSVQARFQQIISHLPDIEMIHQTPEQLASLCGCSARHFNRLFRQYFGQSTRARQTELRLLRARQLLGDTDEKVTRIALESGYRSLSLFNSLFKRRFGITPSEWRQSVSQNVVGGDSFRP